MITRIFRLRGRQHCCSKIFYLIILSSFFISLSYVFTSNSAYAKPVPPLPKHALDNHEVAEPIAENKENLKPLPILRNEEGDGALNINGGDEVNDAPKEQVDSVAERKDSHVVAVRNNPRSKITDTVFIHNEKYPKLNNDGNFIPMRRIVQLDLKGAPYKANFFVEIFAYLKRINATGILLEWEDMFPYTGRLSEATNGNAYTMEDVENILSAAKKYNLDIIPLVQTIGHLEWILKLEKFEYLREDPLYPQAICFADNDSWDIIQDMIDQVAGVHAKFGMPFFHIGADEVFQVGTCNASMQELPKQGSRERLLMWHISRTAAYVKDKYKTTVLAWHDMFANALENDILHYGMPELLEPVLWSYAEDLNMYLPRSTWLGLQPFPRVWGSSAWKGADGPARYNSNPAHYIKNHESWIDQLTSVYKDFDVIQGMIMTGWSRYDHLAVLAELLPLGIPALSMSMETMLEGRKLQGTYSATADVMQCSPSVYMGVTWGCRFPGSKIYELVNDYWQRHQQLKKYKEEDFEVNGWLSRLAEVDGISSRWYIDKIAPNVEYHHKLIKEIEESLRAELSKIYFTATIDEWIFTFMGEDLEWLDKKMNLINRLYKTNVFPKRPTSISLHP